MTAGDRIIRFTAVAAVLMVAAIAGYVSYWHAVAVVQVWGAESPFNARLIPLTTDGLVVASSLLMLSCTRYGQPVPALARWTLGLGITATIGANALHGVSATDPHRIISPEKLGPVIAAWSAVVLVLTYELVLQIIRVEKTASQAATAGQHSPGLSYSTNNISQSPEPWLTDVPVSDRDQTPPPSVPDTTPTPIYDAVRSEHSVMSAPGSDVSRIRPQPNTSPRRVSPLDMSEDRTAIVAAMVLENPDLSGADVGRRFGLTSRQGLRILRRAQASMNGKPVDAP